MKFCKLTLSTLFLLLSHNSFAVDLTTQKQKYSYAIGIQLGQMLRAQDVTDLDIDAFSAAIADHLSHTTPQLSQPQMRESLKLHYQQRQTERTKTATENSTKGAQFRKENGQRDIVTTLENGLQFEVLKAGDGPSPTAKDKVEVHYQGTLIDGSVFDSSYSQGKPVQFNLNGVVAGFREAIVRMKPGAKWRVVMPPEMAYGEMGAGKKIGPNETLVFEIEYIGLAAKPSTK